MRRIRLRLTQQLIMPFSRTPQVCQSPLLTDMKRSSPDCQIGLYVLREPFRAKSIGAGFEILHLYLSFFIFDLEREQTLDRLGQVVR